MLLTFKNTDAKFKEWMERSRSNGIVVTESSEETVTNHPDVIVREDSIVYYMTYQNIIVLSYLEKEQEFLDELIQYAELEPPSIETMRIATHQRINDDFVVASGEILRKYHQSDITSWYKQEQEARAWAASNLAHTPFLDAMLSNHVRTKQELVDDILQKSNEYKVFIGRLLGKRTLARHNVNTLSNIDDIFYTRLNMIGVTL